MSASCALVLGTNSIADMLDKLIEVVVKGSFLYKPRLLKVLINYRKVCFKHLEEGIHLLSGTAFLHLAERLCSINSFTK